MKGSCADCGCPIPAMDWKCWDCFDARPDDEDRSDDRLGDSEDHDRLVGETTAYQRPSLRFKTIEIRDFLTFKNSVEGDAETGDSIKIVNHWRE